MCVCVTRGFCRKLSAKTATTSRLLPRRRRDDGGKCSFSIQGSAVKTAPVNSHGGQGLHQNQETKNNHRKMLISIQCVAHGDSNWDLYSSEILQLQEISETSVPPASSSPNSDLLRSYWTLLSSDASGKQTTAQF